jgi:hypothetical protein
MPVGVGARKLFDQSCRLERHVSISFFAYHRQPEQRQIVIDRIRRLAGKGLLGNGTEGHGQSMSFLEALTDGNSDPAVVHETTGFPHALSQLCESIFRGLPSEQAAVFALDLVQAAQSEANVSDVPSLFLVWLIHDALINHGKSRLQSSAKGKGPVLTKLSQVETGPATGAKARMLARQARRHGLPHPTSDEEFAQDAINLFSFGGNAAIAVDWIASIAPEPEEQYRQCACKLIELVKAA